MFRPLFAAIFRVMFDGNINVFWSQMLKSTQFIDPDDFFLIFSTFFCLFV